MVSQLARLAKLKVLCALIVKLEVEARVKRWLYIPKFEREEADS